MPKMIRSHHQHQIQGISSLAHFFRIKIATYMYIAF